MRIALLTRRFDSAGGGTERDLIVTAQCLRAAGHQITIFADEIRGAPATGKFVASARPRLGRALSLLRFAWTAAPAARRAGTDLVLSFARCVGADVIRSGGGAHASYLRAARKWRGALGATAMRLSPYHQAQMLVERQAFRNRAAQARDRGVEFGARRSDSGIRPRARENGDDLQRRRSRPLSARRRRRSERAAIRAEVRRSGQCARGRFRRQRLRAQGTRVPHRSVAAGRGRRVSAGGRRRSRRPTNSRGARAS